MRAITLTSKLENKGHYVPGMISGDKLYVSGQLPVHHETGSVPPFQFFSSATASISTSAPWCSARVGTTTRAGLWLPKKAA